MNDERVQSGEDEGIDAPAEPRTGSSVGRQYRRRVLVAVGFAVLAAGVFWLIVSAAQVFAVAFAGILLGTLLHGGAAAVASKIPGLSDRVAAILIAAAAAAAVVGTVWAVGPALAGRMANLRDELAGAMEQSRATLQEYSWGKAILDQVPSMDGMEADGGDVLKGVMGTFSTLLGGVTAVFVILFVGFYIGIAPDTYVRGLMHLVPPHERARFRSVLGSAARALRWWFVGQAASMVVVGILTWIGLALMGFPLALMLAVIAALFAFVPNVGPVLSAVPAILIGFSMSPQDALYVAALYIGVQTVESYAITPVIQERVVSMPPALLLFVQLLLAVLLGMIGLFIATPLLVATVVFVQIYYVRGGLHDPVDILQPQAEILRESASDPAEAEAENGKKGVDCRE